MNNQSVGLIPSILLLYFPLSYFLQMPTFNSINFPIQSAIMFIGIIYLLGKGLKLSTVNDLKPTYIYMIFLTSVISLTSIAALNPSYSFSRGIVSILFFAILITLFYEMNKTYYRSFKWRRFLSFSFLISLIIIIVGQLVIPEWRAGIGGVRLSGGTNANQVAFFAIFIIFISHYNALIDNKWTKLQKSNWLLAFVVLFWSMSRSNILSFIVMYSIYLVYNLFRDDISLLLRGRVGKKSLKKLFYIFVTIVASIGFLNYFKSRPDYVFIEQRFLGEQGLNTREVAWEYLLSFFYQNPILGGLGWFNATNVLDNINGATSPHNLYVRLLSETGLLGTTAVMAFPLILCLGLLIKNSRIQEKRFTFYKKQIFITFAFVIAIFVGQYFEDRYLVGFINMGNSIFIWSLAICLLLIKGDLKQLLNEK